MKQSFSFQSEIKKFTLRLYPNKYIVIDNYKNMKFANTKTD